MEKTFDISTFKSSVDSLIATNENSYKEHWTRGRNSLRLKDYTKKDVEDIIRSGSEQQQRLLSKNYFYKDGFYRRILIFYATLLKYEGILIPNPAPGKSLSTPHIKKRYFNALDYVERMKVKDFCNNCALRAVIEGTYFGVKIVDNKDTISVLDLPGDYCRSRFKDSFGNDIIEFDVRYFRTITDAASRLEALRAYPKVISRHFNSYDKGKTDTPWVFIPSDIGICFPLFDGRPLFLTAIPSTIDYDEAVETEKERDLEEIKKIVVQKVPHLSDGTLLFEPTEAAEIHRGTVGMMKNNKNVSVLTTYADVDSIVSKTGADTATTNLEKMVKNIYYQAGVSGQLFSSDSNLSLETSIKNDMAMMMTLGLKFSNFITTVINKHFANSNISFKYNILPITFYNEEKYVDSAFKLANGGYSFLVPAVAQGLSQRDLTNIKELENEVLELDKLLIPLSSAFNSGGGISPADSGDPGAPQKDGLEKSPKTIKNQESLDKGGSK